MSTPGIPQQLLDLAEILPKFRIFVKTERFIAQDGRFGRVVALPGIGIYNRAWISSTQEIPVYAVFLNSLEVTHAMGHRDWTEMGGLHETFLTTHWSQVEAIQNEGDRDSLLIGHLLEQYWKPVYCYLRRKGFSNEKAKDLTQAFFCEVVLDRNLVGRADPANGSFRSLLLHALRHFVIDSHRRETSGKQIPKEKLVSMETADLPELEEIGDSLDPEESFNYAWKAELLERALSEVKQRLKKQSMELHWLAFHTRVLHPAMQDQKPPPLHEICASVGIENEGKASQMIQTVKRNLQKTLARLVRQTVCDDQAMAEEFEEIAGFLKD